MNDDDMNVNDLGDDEEIIPRKPKKDPLLGDDLDDEMLPPDELDEDEEAEEKEEEIEEDEY